MECRPTAPPPSGPPLSLPFSTGAQLGWLHGSGASPSTVARTTRATLQDPCMRKNHDRLGEVDHMGKLETCLPIHQGSFLAQQFSGLSEVGCSAQTFEAWRTQGCRKSEADFAEKRKGVSHPGSPGSEIPPGKISSTFRSESDRNRMGGSLTPRKAGE